MGLAARVHCVHFVEFIGHFQEFALVESCVYSLAIVVDHAMGLDIRATLVIEVLVVFVVHLLMGSELVVDWIIGVGVVCGCARKKVTMAALEPVTVRSDQLVGPRNTAFVNVKHGSTSSVGLVCVESKKVSSPLQFWRFRRCHPT
ncbi:unnamed protein product [Citrullus colocynthis]|uniref:Uncharacterized protein n=1 Tax=Citrullus colocynthis TaxID=252529 RepID=A0ABP0XNP8_9ROSI